MLQWTLLCGLDGAAKDNIVILVNELALNGNEFYGIASLMDDSTD